jgi:AcrR family transcriptional regulator
MARIVKEYEVRRSEILDLALRLVYTKGYEQMTVQDILDELKISKGAFYHYFDSKQALLEALIEHTLDEAMQVITPIVDDPSLAALDKLKCVFDTATRWKTAQKAFFLGILRVWYQDGNALVRQKQLAASIQQVAPLVTRIVHQGIREGVMSTSYPDQVGEIALTFLQGLGDTMAGLILAGAPESEVLAQMEGAIKAYTDALERVLGAPPGSLHLIDIENLKEWIVTT